MKNQILTMGILAIVASLGFTAISSDAVFGQGAPQQGVPDHANPNAAFGQGASGFPPGEMGQHASNPIPDNGNVPPQDIDRDTPRTGIGNLGHPAGVACTLNPSLTLCP